MSAALPESLVDAAEYGLRFGAGKQSLSLHSHDVRAIARCVLSNALGHGVVLWEEHDKAVSELRSKVAAEKANIGAVRAEADRQVSAMAAERDAAYERLRALDEAVPEWWTASRPKPVAT